MISIFFKNVTFITDSAKRRLLNINRCQFHVGILHLLIIVFVIYSLLGFINNGSGKNLEKVDKLAQSFLHTKKKKKIGCWRYSCRWCHVCWCHVLNGYKYEKPVAELPIRQLKMEILFSSFLKVDFIAFIRKSSSCYKLWQSSL